ncbi:MAG: sugar phosphate isomerase/epimerase family protein [Candidatus Bipolaricaulia bacterium]
MKGLKGINVDGTKLNGDIQDLERQLELFSNVGFDAVEVPVHGVEAVLNGRLQKSISTRVASLLKNFNFTYTVHAPDYLRLSPSREDLEVHKEVFMACVEFTSLIDSSLMVYHTDLNQTSTDKEKAKEADLVAEVGKTLDDKDVTVAVENMRNTHPIELAQFLNQIDHERIRMCYDLGHAYIFSKVFKADFFRCLKEVKSSIAHIHLHDNFGKGLEAFEEELSTAPFIHKYPFGIGDLHLPPGWGKIPFTNIFDVLDDYQDIWLMEIDPRFSKHYRSALKFIKEK